MWCLDPATSPALMKALRPHWRDPPVDVAWVGVGWRDVVAACHTAIVERFPDYQLLAVEQHHGVLAFKAVPSARSAHSAAWTPGDLRELNALVDTFATRSAIVCEWCGGDGWLHNERAHELTLCDQCNEHISDPPRPGLDRSEQ